MSCDSECECELELQTGGVSFTVLHWYKNGNGLKVEKVKIVKFHARLLRYFTSGASPVDHPRSSHTIHPLGTSSWRICRSAIAPASGELDAVASMMTDARRMVNWLWLQSLGFASLLLATTACWRRMERPRTDVDFIAFESLKSQQQKRSQGEEGNGKGNCNYRRR